MSVVKEITAARYKKLFIPIFVWLVLFGCFLVLMNLVIQWEVEKQLWQKALSDGFYKTRLLRNVTLSYMVNQRQKNLRELVKNRDLNEIFRYFFNQKEIIFGQIEDEKGVVWCDCKTNDQKEIPSSKIDLFWSGVESEFNKTLKKFRKVKTAPYYNLILPIIFNGQQLGRISLGFASSSTISQIREISKNIRMKLSLYTALGLLLFIMLSYYIGKLLFRINRLQTQAVEREHFALVGRMANGLAHELKNPLNAMSMSIQMLDEDLENEEINREQFSEMVTDIKNEASRLSGVLEEFLKFARPTPLKLGQNNLMELINSVARLLRPQFVMKNVELVITQPEKMPEILLDAEKIKQVLINLFLNSLEASYSGNKMEIEVEYRKKEVIIKIRDFGSGIKPDNMPFIFDTYFTTKKSGSGLGLAITKKIIEEHEGSIEVESIPKVKTIFTITLPAKRSL